MDKNAKLTIADIAEKAGVSISTVSRVLNGKNDVSDKTRQKVQMIIDQSGYTPFLKVTQTIQERIPTIAFLYPLQSDFTPRDQGFATGIAAAAGEDNYRSQFITRDLTRQEIETMVLDKEVDGLIVGRATEDDWRVDYLLEHDFPFVLLRPYQNKADERLTFVGLDYPYVVEKVFQYLIDLAHENIGFMTFPRSAIHQKFLPAVQSIATYEQIIQQHQLPNLMCPVEYTSDSGFRTTMDLLQINPNISAIFTFHEINIPGIISALQQLGKRIPHDVSLMGLVTPYSSELIIPKLTFMKYDSFEIGYQAAQLLLGILSGRAANGQVILRPELIIGNSTAKYNK